MKKKIVILMALTMTVLSMFAEGGKWTVSVHEADELTGTEAGAVYIYDVEGMGSMVIWDWEKPQFRLVGERQFDMTSYHSSSCYYTGLNVNVGIYSANGTLEEKFTMWLDAERSKANRFIKTRDAGGMFNPIGQKKHVKKIFAAMRDPGKYVRFVCDRYNATHFDLTVTPFIPNNP